MNWQDALAKWQAAGKQIAEEREQLEKLFLVVVAEARQCSLRRLAADPPVAPAACLEGTVPDPASDGDGGNNATVSIPVPGNATAADNGGNPGGATEGATLVPWALKSGAAAFFNDVAEDKDSCTFVAFWEECLSRWVDVDEWDEASALKNMCRQGAEMAERLSAVLKEEKEAFLAVESARAAFKDAFTRGDWRDAMVILRSASEPYKR